MEKAIIDVDYIFHAAALKQVPSCEFFPMEAVKTNVNGINNLIDLAIKHNVKKIIALSTDKAVYPINAMGLSKSLMEKIIISRSRINKKKNFNGRCQVWKCSFFKGFSATVIYKTSKTEKIFNIDRSKYDKVFYNYG